AGYRDMNGRSMDFRQKRHQTVVSDAKGSIGKQEEIIYYEDESAIFPKELSEQAQSVQRKQQGDFAEFGRAVYALDDKEKRQGLLRISVNLGVHNLFRDEEWSQRLGLTTATSWRVDYDGENPQRFAFEMYLGRSAAGRINVFRNLINGQEIRQTFSARRMAGE